MVHRTAHRAVTAIVVIAAALLVPSVAGASQVAFDGHVLTYTAAPGENNSVLVSPGLYDTTCGGLPTPCLQVSESYAAITIASPSCVLTYAGLGGQTAACPVPESVHVDLGDGDDAYWDWDGPSVIDGGAGNDNPIFGHGGDDVIRGGSGNDVLFGEAGDDTLDGGTGDDDLEGVPGGVDVGLNTTGADTYIGGGGADSLTYERRSEDLMISPDGQADDGAPGEHDNIGDDVETIVAGNGNDRMIGNAQRNVFAGATGDDVISGGAGDDSLYGGTGADRLDGGDGLDLLEGDDGDDHLTGGPGVDTFYGEAALYSYVGSDTIDARDGNQEYVHCGGGSDTAEIDANDFITGTLWGLDDACETVHTGAPAAGPGGAAGGGLAILSARSGRAGRLVVRLSLPGAGRVAVAVSARLGGRSARIARKRAAAAGAGPLRLTLRLSSRARRALRRGRLAAKVRATFTPAGGAGRTVSKRVALH
jgi:hypothetical protein